MRGMAASKIVWRQEISHIEETARPIAGKMAGAVLRTSLALMRNGGISCQKHHRNEIEHVARNRSLVRNEDNQMARRPSLAMAKLLATNEAA